MRIARALAWLGLAVLLALHLDFWRPQRARLHLGWLPEELLWRLAWMALAWLYLLFVLRWLWTADGATDDDGGPA